MAKGWGRRHGMEGVDDGSDARADGNFGAFELRWIAGAVDILMMMQHVEAGLLEPGKLANHGPAVFRVALDQLELFGSQATGFIEDAVGNADLTDVVE